MDNDWIIKACAEHIEDEHGGEGSDVERLVCYHIVSVGVMEPIVPVQILRQG